MIGYINGIEVVSEPNETISNTAKRHGHFIPMLCELADIHRTSRTYNVCLVHI